MYEGIEDAKIVRLCGDVQLDGMILALAQCDA